MKTSLKPFAAFLVTIGISGMGAANSAVAAGHGSHGSGGHAMTGSSHSRGNRGSHPLEKRNSRRFDQRRDHYRDRGRYNFWCSPWNYRSSFCYPSYCQPYCQPCYTPSFCCESVPEFCTSQPCPAYCPPSPTCEEAPCCPSFPEYCNNYCFPGCYGDNCYRPWFDRGFDHYKNRDYRKDRDNFKGRPDSSKLSRDMLSGKGRLAGGPKGNSGIGRMAMGGRSGGSHGGRR